MKLLTIALSAAVLAFSSGSLASSSPEKLTALQDACQLKRVIHLCAVNLPDRSYIGRCVDTTYYGLICLHTTRR